MFYGKVMPEGDLIQALTEQQAQLAPSYDTCLETVVGYFNNQCTADEMNTSLINHGSHILDVAQEFLGEHDLYDYDLIGAFVTSHTLYHLHALGVQLGTKTHFTSSVPPETIQKGSSTHVQEIIDRAKAGEDIDVIEEAHLFVIGAVSDVINNVIEYADHYRNAKIITHTLPKDTFVLKETMF